MAGGRAAHTEGVGCSRWVGHRKVMYLQVPRQFLHYVVLRPHFERYLSSSPKILRCPFSPLGMLEKQRVAEAIFGR